MSVKLNIDLETLFKVKQVRMKIETVLTQAFSPKGRISFPFPKT